VLSGSSVIRREGEIDEQGKVLAPEHLRVGRTPSNERRRRPEANEIEPDERRSGRQAHGYRSENPLVCYRRSNGVAIEGGTSLARGAPRCEATRARPEGARIPGLVRLTRHRNRTQLRSQKPNTTETRRHRGRTITSSSLCLCASVVFTLRASLPPPSGATTRAGDPDTRRFHRVHRVPRQDRLRAWAGERRLPGKHFVHNHAERVDIGAGVEPRGSQACSGLM